MSDLKPPGHAYGAFPRIGYEASAHALEWPDASGDEWDADPNFPNACRLVVWDAMGRVLIRIED